MIEAANHDTSAQEGTLSVPQPAINARANTREKGARDQEIDFMSMIGPQQAAAVRDGGGRSRRGGFDDARGATATRPLAVGLLSGQLAEADVTAREAWPVGVLRFGVEAELERERDPSKGRGHDDSDR